MRFIHIFDTRFVLYWILMNVNLIDFIYFFNSFADKKVKKPEKPASTAPASPTKAVPRPAPAPKVQPKAPPPASIPKEKKSTSSRREELLKQLKAVEDAIARKRSKIN